MIRYNLLLKSLFDNKNVFNRIYKIVLLLASQFSPASPLQVPNKDRQTFPQWYKLGLNLTFPYPVVDRLHLGGVLGYIYSKLNNIYNKCKNLQNTNHIRRHHEHKAFLRLQKLELSLNPFCSCRTLRKWRLLRKLEDYFRDRKIPLLTLILWFMEDFLKSY